jgi:peptidoglycan/LPS O-acetylase OafA/YrhL
MRLSEHARGRDNAFDVLRLGAATLVLVSHSFALAGRGEPMLGQRSLGALGVQVFFAISGFLVVMSWSSQPRLRPFLVKRGLRILPALTVTVLLSALVLGLLVSDRPALAYLQSPETLAYAPANVLAVASGGLLHGLAYDLPGVFAGNPRGSVNGSLWTLPIEVQAYFLVALTGLVGLQRRLMPAVAALGAAGAAAAAAGALAGLPVLGAVLTAREEALQLLAIFSVGSLLFLHRERVPVRVDLAAAALAAWLASMVVAGAAEIVVGTLAIPYLVLVLAFRSSSRLRWLTRPGDVSYGLYLLAFPVQQTLLHLLPGLARAPLALFAAALPITYALSFASWRLVERPALRLKGVLLAPRRRARAAEAVAPAAPGR